MVKGLRDLVQCVCTRLPALAFEPAKRYVEVTATWGWSRYSCLRALGNTTIYTKVSQFEKGSDSVSVHKCRFRDTIYVTLFDTHYGFLSGDLSSLTFGKCRPSAGFAG